MKTPAAATLLMLTLALAAPAADNRRSGFDDMTAPTQALQRDDTLNPAMLFVGEGERLWSEKAGRARMACADCHPGEAAQSMRGVAARYPGFDAASAKPVNLAGRINLCRQRHQQAEALPLEGEALLALEAYVGMASRGQPIAARHGDARLAPFIEQGRQLYNQRIGQLDLSCAQCHDQHAGRKLGGSPIPQAHPTGYPIYRLEWQGMGSLQRRLRNCIGGVRAEVPAYGAADLVALELFLAQRAAGMAVETPAVRP